MLTSSEIFRRETLQTGITKVRQPMDAVVRLDPLRKLDPGALSSVIRDSAGYHFFKRALDVTVAAIALVILLPAMALIAVLIAVDSPGSVIFSQKRVGARRWTRGGSGYWRRVDFTCYKFRTMVQDAETSIHQHYVEAFINGRVEPSGSEGTQFKLANDTRVTRVGRILRRTSMDELPQLANVLKGEMSLVGPRPPIQYEVDEYQPWHCGRLQAKPGLTGLWQVTARSSAEFDVMARLDINYIENQTLWLDLQILLKTLPAVWSGKGAV